MNFSKTAVNALMLKAAAERAEAVASLELLLNHGVGVGEHSTKDLHDNLNEALSKLDDAESRIDCIKRNFSDVLPLQENET